MGLGLVHCCRSIRCDTRLDSWNSAGYFVRLQEQTCASLHARQGISRFPICARGQITEVWVVVCAYACRYHTQYLVLKKPKLGGSACIFHRRSVLVSTSAAAAKGNKNRVRSGSPEALTHNSQQPDMHVPRVKRVPARGCEGNRTQQQRPLSYHWNSTYTYPGSNQALRK